MTLKPCPFCGSECRYTDTVYFAVKCTGCNAIGPPSFEVSTAIKAWNTRAPTEANARADAAVEALKQIDDVSDHWEKRKPNVGYNPPMTGFMCSQEVKNILNLWRMDKLSKRIIL